MKYRIVKGRRYSFPEGCNILEAAWPGDCDAIGFDFEADFKEEDDHALKLTIEDQKEQIKHLEEQVKELKLKVDQYSKVCGGCKRCSQKMRMD